MILRGGTGAGADAELRIDVSFGVACGTLISMMLKGSLSLVVISDVSNVVLGLLFKMPAGFGARTLFCLNLAGVVSLGGRLVVVVFPVVGRKAVLKTGRVGIPSSFVEACSWLTTASRGTAGARCRDLANLVRNSIFGWV